MANDKKNINELVDDDEDQTAELEALVPPPFAVDAESEAAASTAGFAKSANAVEQSELALADLKADLIARSETIDRLQFDTELLRTKWQGLATEIQAREEHADKLNTELKNAKQALQQKTELVAEHESEIRALKIEIQHHTEGDRDLPEDVPTLSLRDSVTSIDGPLDDEHFLAVQSGQLVSDKTKIRELRARIAKIEDYADQLRYLLRDRENANKDFDVDLETLEHRIGVGEIDVPVELIAACGTRVGSRNQGLGSPGNLGQQQQDG